MTVEELVESLRKFAPGTEIRLVQPNHDYCGTSSAVPIDGVCKETCYPETEYDAPRLVENPDDDEETTELLVIY